MTLTRAFAVLAAANMVAAFALAILLPPLESLAELAAQADSNIVVNFHDFVIAHASIWTWSRLALPVLTRPSWMVPVCLGIICAGAASSLASRKPVSRSRHRRS